MSEYSYFRADGRSLQAIELIHESKAKLQEMGQRLAKRYGAISFNYWPAKEGRSSPKAMFTFSESAKVPPSFEIIQVNITSDHVERDVFTHPKPGTPVEYQVKCVMDLMERYFKLQRLEDALECGEMPMRERTEGGYSSAFVKSHAKMTPMNHQEGKSFGLLQDRVTMVFGTNVTMTGPDPLDFIEMAGDWYIRVPNDKTGKPCFTPPDAEPVPFGRMMELDKVEFEKRNPFHNLRIPGF